MIHNMLNFTNFNYNFNLNIDFDALFQQFNASFFNISNNTIFWGENIYYPPQNNYINTKNTDNYEKQEHYDNSKKITEVTKSDSIFSNYNVAAGKKLANIALNDSVGFTKKCATYVKKAINKANLGNYQQGHAYQMTNILKNNKNFEEISVENVDVKSLPAGCVLVYDKGVNGYSSKYGHTEITTGDGRAVSDGITNNLYKKPSAIFMPIIT